MIKKLIVLLVLAAAGYVGYLAWNKYLSPRDKEKIVQKLKETGQAVEEKASGLAKKTAEVVQEKMSDSKTAPDAGR